MAEPRQGTTVGAPPYSVLTTYVVDGQVAAETATDDRRVAAFDTSSVGITTLIIDR